MDNREAAKEAGLRYVDPTKPGLSRHRAGSGFSYRDADGNRITDKKILERIKAIVIPPAWEDVWISPSANGHIQATGRDERGRKQYRYHPEWTTCRSETRYGKMLDFGKALPSIRERVEQDLKLPGLAREKVLATVVALLDATLIRMGNEEYAQSNRSYGLTTLRDKHVGVVGDRIEIAFRGKSGVEREIELRSKELAKIVKRCQDLPGQQLFQYLDEDGNRHDIHSTDVNDYLREITGDDFTAKDFRTWAGTVLAATTLADAGSANTKTDAEATVVAAIDIVASQLGNTRAVCRKCYVHPVVIDAYLDGETIRKSGRQTEEQAVMKMIRDSARS